MYRRALQSRDELVRLSRLIQVQGGRGGVDGELASDVTEHVEAKQRLCAVVLNIDSDITQHMPADSSSNPERRLARVCVVSSMCSIRRALAFDWHPAERAPLLIVEFKLQTSVPARGVPASRREDG
jgi:hypothetical protein